MHSRAVADPYRGEGLGGKGFKSAHSMISSAQARMKGGIVRRSAGAAFTLTTSCGRLLDRAWPPSGCDP
jgi:hypothetical protein